MNSENKLSDDKNAPSRKRAITLLLFMWVAVLATIWYFWPSAKLEQPASSSPVATAATAPTGKTQPEIKSAPTTAARVELPVQPPAQKQTPSLAKPASKPATKPVANTDTPEETAEKTKTASTFVKDAIAMPLMAYRTLIGFYPTELQDLITRPAGRDGQYWKEPFMEGTDVPLDPWGNPYQYTYPGTHHGGQDFYDVWSMGPNGENGAPEEAIGNW